MFLAISACHIGQVENYGSGQIVRFGNLKYVTDSCGELVLQDLSSCWAQEQQVKNLTHQTTHLIANIEDLTGILEGAIEEQD